MIVLLPQQGTGTHVVLGPVRVRGRWDGGVGGWGGEEEEEEETLLLLRLLRLSSSPRARDRDLEREEEEEEERRLLLFFMCFFFFLFFLSLVSSSSSLLWWWWWCLRRPRRLSSSSSSALARCACLILSCKSSASLQLPPRFIPPVLDLCVDVDGCVVGVVWVVVGRPFTFMEKVVGGRLRGDLAMAMRRHEALLPCVKQDTNPMHPPTHPLTHASICATTRTGFCRVRGIGAA